MESSKAKENMEIYAFRVVSMGMLALTAMLIIIHAFASNRTESISYIGPYLSIIPAFFSAALGYCLHHTKKGVQYRDSQLQRHVVLLFLTDSALCIFNMVICILNIVALAEYRPNTYILAVYGTLPLLVNIVVHATLLARRGALLLSKQHWPGQTLRCANCGGKNWYTEDGQGWTRPGNRFNPRRWEEYNPEQHEDRYRDPKDDDRIRLSADEATALIGVNDQETGVEHGSSARAEAEGA